MADQAFFETPLFKKLSKTDADEGKSHVAGILILVKMRPYFPDIPPPTTEQPAPSVPIAATLIIPGKLPQEVEASYQFQTRANKRKPESRLTGIEPLRKAATTGDFVLLERSTLRDDMFRITLVKKSDPKHDWVASKAKTKAIVLDLSSPPVQLPAVDAALAEIEAKASAPFELFDDMAQWIPQGLRVARAKAFSRVVAAAYGQRCAMCGQGMSHPSGRTEIESAHIVSRSVRGADDVRNGLALCRVHHWAFDNYLVGIRPDGSLEVPQAAAAMIGNESLASLNGAKLIVPSDPAHRPHPDALTWASTRFDKEWAT
jgi:putative restriction endonuclease